LTQQYISKRFSACSARIGCVSSKNKDIIKNISKCENTFEFQELDLLIRKNFIKRFKEKGLSIRQISRLTGVSKGIVEKI